MADQQIGWLATTVTLYNELEKDIQRAFSSVHQAVGKVLIRFPDNDLHQDIAKSVAVLHPWELACRCAECCKLNAPFDYLRLSTGKGQGSG